MNVVLVVFQDAPPDLARRVASALPFPWHADEPARRVVDFKPLLDQSRLQLEATRLVEMLPADDPARCWIALVGVDLFLQPLAWVCGVAPVSSHRGAVSWARLGEGLSAMSPLMIERVVKEVAHELGHAAGLVHCPVPDCVMHASLYPDEIDLKPASYCEPCLASLQQLIAAAPPPHDRP